MASRIINYLGNEQIYNKEKVDELLDNKQDKLEIDKVVSPNSTNPVENKAIAKAIKTLEDKHDADLEEEATKRAEGDKELAGKIGNLTSLKTVAKTDVVTAINELHNDLLPIDTVLDPDSTHAVENKAVYKGIKDLKDKHDADMQLEADTRKHADDLLEKKHDKDVTDLTKKIDDDIKNLANRHNSDMQLEADTRHQADDLLDTRVTELETRLLPMDEAPTEDSEMPAKSGGTFDAIRFASVRVGETMYWHLQDDSSPENREVHSNNPFVFNFKGQEVSAETRNGNVQLCVLKNVPDGWHALDGKAELNAVDYPDLAAFMPENVTTDGKIWLPYVQHKIIKVKY